MIKGNGHIIFKYNNVEYELEETENIKDDQISKEIILESELANEISIYNYNERHEVNELYNIYKNSTSIAQFKTIYALRNNTVKLRFSAGKYFLDYDGNQADYYMTMKLTNYKTDARHDYMLISFRSLKPIDFVSSALPENVLVDSRGMILTDSNGKYLTTDD